MDFKQLRYFVAVYEEGHVGRAAERLSLSQPALSQQIRQLEHSLDLSLFERSNKRLLPTLAAHTLYNHALPLLDGLQRAHEAMRNFKGQSLRTLAIGVLQTVRPSLVPQLLERLRCPACRAALAFRQDKQDFRCDGCKRVYPIRDGVPVLLVEEATLE